MATVNIYEMAQTWNEGSTVFTAIKMDVTDTASDAASLLMDLQVGGASKASIKKNGVLKLVGVKNKPIIDLDGTSGPMGIGKRFNNSFGFYTQSILQAEVSTQAVDIYNILRLQKNVYLGTDAADTLAQRNGINPQLSRKYNSYTDGSNGEWLEHGFDGGNNAVLRPQANGTGTTRNLHISGLPTSYPGTGILWNDGGTVKVGV